MKPVHEIALQELNTLAQAYSVDYASPHHFTMSVDGLRNLIDELQNRHSQPSDTDRLDWLESQVKEHGLLALYDGADHPGGRAVGFGPNTASRTPTLRTALDLHIEIAASSKPAPNAEEIERAQHVLEAWFCDELGIDMASTEFAAITRKMFAAAKDAK